MYHWGRFIFRHFVHFGPDLTYKSDNNKHRSTKAKDIICDILKVFNIIIKVLAK